MKLSANLKSLTSLAFIAGLFIFLVSPPLASKTFEPVFNPTLNISRTSIAIDIDGDLDDQGWRDASSSDNFVERYPGDNIEPLVKTKMMITYNQDYLYVGFICYDDPSDIRATMCQRDQFFGNDAVVIMIDTYGDATWAYEFYVNPYGIQKDYLWTNITGEDSGYDLIWKSAAKITPTGYQVEMAIPFNSIRFPNQDVQTWKMDFWRIHPRDSYHQYSWTANDRNEQCWPCKWGTVNGIVGVRPGKGIEILPSWIANQRGNISNAYDPETPFENEDIMGELSLGGKYSINSDITFEGTFNPDFSQIEADAAQIDVNSPVALFLNERRPFFQEGRDIFRTLFNSLDTRTIHDPEFAAKLTGRSGKYRFGLISAVDENSFYTIPLEETMVWPFSVGKSYVNVFRGMRSFGESSQLGFIINDRRFEAGGHNTVLGLDQNIRLSPTYRICGQYLMTLTEEPDDSALFYSNYVMNDADYNIGFNGESYTGYGFITQLRRNARHWNVVVDYNQVDRNYRTETGYDPWIDYRNFSTWTSYNIYFDEGLFERMTPQISIDNRWNFDGDRKWTHFNTALSGNIRYAQTHFSISFNYGDESWSGVRFNDLWSFHLYGSSTFSDKLGYYFVIEKGVDAALNVLEKGNEIHFESGLDIKPIDRLLLEPNFEYLKSNHVDTDVKLFENYVFRTRLRFQATKALSFRLVAQYYFRESLRTPSSAGVDADYVAVTDKYWSIDPLITYRLNPFTVLYVGSSYNYDRLPYDYYPVYSPDPDPEITTDWQLSDRIFFMKLQYLFQI